VATYLAIDIGKSRVSVGILDDDLQIVEREQTAVSFADGGEAMLSQAASAAAELQARADAEPAACGVSIAAFVNPDRNETLTSGFIPEWKGLDLAGRIAKQTGLPVAMNGNVRAAALAEAIAGAGKGSRVVTYVVMSTGFGMATVVGGEIYRGGHDIAGQIGFTKLGGRGDLNQLLSGSGLSGVGSRELGRPVEPDDIFKLAKQQHPIACGMVAASEKALATVIAWIQSSLDPDVIVFGGSIALNQPEFVESAAKRSLEFLGRPHKEILGDGPNVRLTKLGADAGLVGAGILAKRAGG
jgi:glucokinase